MDCLNKGSLHKRVLLGLEATKIDATQGSFNIIPFDSKRRDSRKKCIIPSLSSHGNTKKRAFMVSTEHSNFIMEAMKQVKCPLPTLHTEKWL